MSVPYEIAPQKTGRTGPRLRLQLRYLVPAPMIKAAADMPLKRHPEILRIEQLGINNVNFPDPVKAYVSLFFYREKPDFSKKYNRQTL